MKAALAGTPPHDFPYPSDEIAKVAGCSRGGYEYYLKGTEPQTGCGGPIEAYGSENEGAERDFAQPQPTVPAGDASPPATIPPPSELPSAPADAPSPGDTPTPQRRR
jgi:hypothetical protein